MTKPTRYLLMLMCLVCLIGPALGQGTSPLAHENIHGRAEVGYFAESDLYRYLADVNLWFDIGQYKDAGFYFNGGILNYISHTSERGFQPERYRGTLELGTYLPRDRSTYYFRVKHQSFHDIDSFDNLDESYEIYTLAYKYSSGVPTFYISVGSFENTKDVDYDWEYFASMELSSIGMCGRKPVYFSGYARRVEESGNPTGRNGFTDYALELGIQTTAGLRYFTGYRQINDINRVNGVKDEQIVLGLKYIW